MPKPVWEGHLRLSLVTCPVALHKATTEGEGVHFHLLHPQTHRRVKQAWRDPEMGDDAPDVARNTLLHGYEMTEGEYVIIDDADLKAVKLDSTKTIQIERFVDATTIDRLYWDQPYFLVPVGKKDLQEPYAVIRDAMAGENRMALGRVVMTGRERIVAIEVRHQGLLLTTLRAAEEVRDEAAAFDGLDGMAADPQMVDIARAIISKQAGDFEPAGFHDRYAEAVRALVLEKAGQHTIKAEPEPAESDVVDLMDALRRSLGGGPVASEPTKKTRTRRKA